MGGRGENVFLLLIIYTASNKCWGAVKARGRR
jgi:hypothetical protein